MNDFVPDEAVAADAEKREVQSRVGLDYARTFQIGVLLIDSINQVDAQSLAALVEQPPVPEVGEARHGRSANLPMHHTGTIRHEGRET